MARVSEASRTGPEGGMSAPSPFGREGAEGGLSKLIRSAGSREGLSVPLVSSNSKFVLLGPTSGVSKSYVSESDVRRSFDVSASTTAGAGIEVIGKGEGTSATRGAVSSASRTLRAPWFTGGQLVAACLAGLLPPSGWLPGLLFVSKAARLHSLGSGAAGFDSGSGFEGAAIAKVEAVCAGVSVSKATACGRMGSLVTGGLGAGFLVSREGEDDEEEAASGDTGGLPLAFRAASLGECLRFGGIGVSDF